MMREILNCFVCGHGFTEPSKKLKYPLCPACEKINSNAGLNKVKRELRKAQSYGRLRKQRKGKYIEFVEDENGCFICTSHANQYPSAVINSVKQSISRHVYEQCFGEIPDGFFILHSCDNNRCINPQHLRAGTYLENIQDMLYKDRNVKGEKCVQHKLTEENVREIRVSKESCIKLASKFGVSKTAILACKNKKSWKHIE